MGLTSVTQDLQTSMLFWMGRWRPAELQEVSQRQYVITFKQVNSTCVSHANTIEDGARVCKRRGIQRRSFTYIYPDWFHREV